MGIDSHAFHQSLKVAALGRGNPPMAGPSLKGHLVSMYLFICQALRQLHLYYFKTLVFLCGLQFVKWYFLHVLIYSTDSELPEGR